MHVNVPESWAQALLTLLTVMLTALGKLLNNTKCCLPLICLLVAFLENSVYSAFVFLSKIELASELR